MLESQTCPIKVETGQETYQIFVMGCVLFKIEALGVMPTFHFQILPVPNFAILQSNSEIFAILLSGIGQVLLRV